MEKQSLKTVFDSIDWDAIKLNPKKKAETNEEITEVGPLEKIVIENVGKIAAAETSSYSSTQPGEALSPRPVL